MDDVVGADVLKQQLAQQVKAYTDTFAEWVEFTDKVAPPIAVIEFNVKNMIPVADEIIGSAKVLHQCGVGGAYGVAAANPDHHRRRRRRGGADRPGV